LSPLQTIQNLRAGANMQTMAEATNFQRKRNSFFFARRRARHSLLRERESEEVTKLGPEIKVGSATVGKQADERSKASRTASRSVNQRVYSLF